MDLKKKFFGKGRVIIIVYRTKENNDEKFVNFNIDRLCAFRIYLQRTKQHLTKRNLLYIGVISFALTPTVLERKVVKRQEIIKRGISNY